jgi:hypothetical protein
MVRGSSSLPGRIFFLTESWGRRFVNSDLDASIDWYTRFFGRSPDSRVGDEVLWEIDDHAWLFIEPNASRT